MLRNGLITSNKGAGRLLDRKNQGKETPCDLVAVVLVVTL